MKIALLQMDIAWEDREANLRRAAALVEEAARAGADVAALPEMFSTGFSMNPADFAEPEDGRTASSLSALAGRHGICLVAGFQTIRPGGGKALNSAHAYGRRGELLAGYGKLHPFSAAGEDRHFRAGDGPVVFGLDGVASSVFICYDLRFPEDFRKVAARVVLIFVIANWPAEREDHWLSLLKARAIENQCFVAGVNRTGRDGNGVVYQGRSAIFGPWGNSLASAGSGEEVLLCEIDPGEAEKTRAKFPFLRDMSP